MSAVAFSKERPGAFGYWAGEKPVGPQPIQSRPYARAGPTRAHAQRPQITLFVVTSGFAVAVGLFVGCEPLPEDTSSSDGVESYTGSSIAIGRSVEVTFDVGRDQFAMVAFDTGTDRSSQASDRRLAGASGGPAWYIVDGSVAEIGKAVQFKVTGIEVNRSPVDPQCSPILVPKRMPAFTTPPSVRCWSALGSSSKSDQSAVILLLW